MTSVSINKPFFGSRCLMAAAACAVLALAAASASAQDAPLRALFLGDQGHHQPHQRFLQLEPVLAGRGIQLTYTEDVSDLNAETLSGYDALVLYANIDQIEPAHAQALLDYVAQGGGFVPIHCASFCFRNSDEVVALIGAQFLRHGTGVFRTTIDRPDHPVMEGFGGFQCWDETYVHHKHNPDQRIVLEYREDDEGREPWTWVRTHGKGRVFYTAWGHDHRAWRHPGFQNLIERGIRWAAGRDPRDAGPYTGDLPFPIPKMTSLPDDLPEPEFVDVGAKIPIYPAGAQWGTQSEPQSRMQVPLTPDESVKRMVVPEGFRIELFVSEPELGGKPIAMTWDERGRLWVAETYDYPNELQPQGQGRDRIRICEDTDGDGRADKFTVFAEKLSIPSTMAFTREGLLVQDGTRTLLLTDTDGDDVADQTKVVFTGWAMGDTHGGVSNFQYGLDNWIWAMQGYNNSRPVVAGERQPAFRQGFFRFRPDGSQLEFIRSTDNNTWGLGISEEGIIFGSTANRNPSVYMPIPNRYYERVRGWNVSLVLRTIADTYLFRPITKSVRQVDQHGGYTAGAGHALYTARRYPREYWNRVAFVCGPTGHLVGSFILRREGAGFESTNPFNLVASVDEWTAPIMAEVGPDGNVWIIDWYNYIVQHNPTPIGFRTGRGNAYETDLRDKKHGRIYRVIYGGDSRYQPLNLANASPAELVETLKHSNMFWRKHAQRLLVERGEQDVVPALLKLIEDPTVDDVGLNVGAIHALWTLEGLGAISPEHPEVIESVHAALRHPSAGVRRNAIQVLPRDDASVDQLLGAGLLNDSDLQVRLTAFLALADLPASPKAAEALVRAMKDPTNSTDQWLREAITSAAANNGPVFLAAATEDAAPSEALVETCGIVAGHVARTAPAEAAVALVTQLVDAHPSLVQATLTAFSDGWPAGQAFPMNAEVESSLETLFARLPIQQRGPLVQLGRRWGSARLSEYAAQVTESLLARLNDTDQSVRGRIEAARDLVGLAPEDADTAALLLDAITARIPPQLATGILASLEASEAPGLADAVIARFSQWTPATRTAAIDLLLKRADSTEGLLQAIRQGDLQIGELALNQRQALSDHPNRRIRFLARRVLSESGSLPSPDRQQVLTELLPLTEQKGDPNAGHEVFRQQCAKCHVHNGEGTAIGPDLTGMAVHPKEELLTQILDPNRSVEGNFRVYTVVTADGRVLQGMLGSESRTTLELFDAEGNKRVIGRDEVEELIASPKSLMPEGFEKQLSTQQIVDLLEFLTQRGKYLPLDLSRVATITSVEGMFNSPESTAERLIFSDWSPKTFQGVPFVLVDPRGGRVPNAILLYGPSGSIPPRMPRSVELPCNAPAKTIHMLSGVSGWGFPMGERGSTTMIVRLHYHDGEVEDHELLNGIHFADYIRRVDVPESTFAFALRNQQLRYLAINPKRRETIDRIELVKGDDSSAPVVMAVTIETE